MKPLMQRATVKGIKADYVKKTIVITAEASLDNFDVTDREILASWAELESAVDIEFSRAASPAPLLDGIG